MSMVAPGPAVATASARFAPILWHDDHPDRLAPLLRDLNAQSLSQAVDQGLTPATRGACDGTLVAANASRHRLVNEATLNQRTQQLANAVAADQAGTAGEAGTVAAPPSLASAV